jgi:hypothetical protein
VLAYELALTSTSPHASSCGGNLDGPLTAIVHDDVSQLDRDAYLLFVIDWWASTGAA